jgi:hypothetical protein
VSVSRLSPHPPRTATGAAALVGLVLAAVVLGACSSSTTAAKTTTTTTTTAASAATTAPGSSGGGSSSQSSQFSALSSSVQASERATYKAVYTSHPTSGASQTITIEQMPPKTVFSTTSGSVINDGTHTYFCSAAGGSNQCVETTSTGSPNPLGSLTNFFNPTTLLSEFHAAQAAAAAHSAGYSVAFSGSTYAGLSAKCLNYSGGGQTVKYCVTDSGILAYAQAAGGTFELTSYSSSPPASDFALPTGVPVITLPSNGATPVVP